MTDLQAKYQKLAAEYSKLRAQIPVLKKAVLDEQATEEQLKNELKDKDQSIRKFEQEIDSLTFRNNQLSTRVSVLQKELEDTFTHGKKHKKMPASATPDSYGAGASIIDEELRSKIEENARLHKQVYESEQEHRDEILRLNDELAALRSKATQHESVLNSITATNNEKISRLQEDKALLEAKIQLQEKETRSALLRSTELEEQLRTTEEELTRQLRELTAVIRHKLPFNDASDHTLSAWNVPRHDHRRHLQARELLSQSGVLVGDLVQALEALYVHSEERARVFAEAVGEQLSDVNRKLCQHLHGHSVYLQPVKQSYQAFIDGITDDSLILLEALSGLQAFASNWKSLVSFVEKILPYQLLSIQEECSLSSCPTTLSSRNMELHGSLQRLTCALGSVDTYVSLLAAQSDVGCSCPTANRAKMFEQLAHALCELHEAAKVLSRHANAKMSLEHQLPTATQKLKATDENILSAVVSLVTCTSKISAFFSGNLNFFTTLPSGSTVAAGAPMVAANPAVAQLRQQAVDYLASIVRPPPESVPYQTALQNRKTVFSFTESKDSLSQQVVSLQEKLSRLEQEREHWLLETQLVQMKYEKESQLNQKLQALQKSDTVLPSGESVYNAGAAMPLTRPAPEGASSTSLLGQVSELDFSAGNAEEAELREQLITKHYMRRITELTSQLQQADSKALHFYAECRALQKRLGMSQRDRDKYHQDLSSANQCIAQLRDELQTTARSYEGQLSMMSEHLAGMNERLTQQKDEIDMLRYQLEQQNPQSTNKNLGKKSSKLGR